MKLNDVDKSVLGRLYDGLARGEYHLLLGAGASIGCTGGDGTKLPTAAELATELLTHFGLEDEDVNLQMAYEVIAGRNDKDGRSRDAYLKERFTNCSYTWQDKIAAIRWAKIWTLNIDDVIEQVYASQSETARQNARAYSWTSLYQEPNTTTNELQVVHLHGYAARLGVADEHPLVFSILEYLQATSARHAWHHIFGDQFLQRPFIVLGARLSDEIDLAEVLRRGNSSRTFSGRPSFVVLKHISEIQRTQFDKWGLIPVEMPAGDFLAECVVRSAEVEAKLVSSLSGGSSRSALAQEEKRFLQQFRWLRTDSDEIDRPNHDLYQGDEPVWADILNDRDVRFEIVDAVLRSISAAIDAPRVYLTCIYGPPGSGKSTALLRVGRELITKGLDVFTFRAEQRPDIRSILWWIRQNPRTALLVDGLADFSDDFGRLASEAHDSGLSLLIIGAERETRLPEIYRGISSTVLPDAGILRVAQLSDLDVNRLIQKLSTERRLGKLTRASSAQRFQYFVRDSKRQLLVGMHGLEHGKGFVERLESEFKEDIKSQELRSVYSAACITFSFGHPLPLGIASGLSGVSPQSIVNATKTTLKGIATLDSRGIKPRHRVIASLIAERALDRTVRFNLALTLAKLFAPYINAETIRQRSAPVRIVRNLMDEKIACDWMGVSRACEWFADLAQVYDWNPRYWEQRSLAEARNKQYPRARSFAEHAVSLRQDTLTYNTLGSILTDMATNYFPVTSSDAEGAFWEGVRALRTARVLGEGRFEHPYITFFSRALRYCDRYKGLPRDAALLDEWQKWMSDAERADIFRHIEFGTQLKEFHSRWLAKTVLIGGTNKKL